MFLVMELLIVMDSCLSDDVSVLWFVYFNGVSTCCCWLSLPLLRFIVVTSFIHLAFLSHSTMGLLSTLVAKQTADASSPLLL
jgi:hypothetical protein